MSRVWYPKRFLAVAALGLALAGAGPAGATERIVSDARTGLALDGFDPVSYFLGEPQEGRARLEAQYRGAVFRFANPGNREAFTARPDRYMPLFGGHDPVSAARGFVARGDPLIAAVDQDRLILFFSTETRERFLADRASILRNAERNWPRLELGLSR